MTDWVLARPFGKSVPCPQCGGSCDSIYDRADNKAFRPEWPAQYEGSRWCPADGWVKANVCDVCRAKVATHRDAADNEWCDEHYPGVGATAY